MHKKLLIIGGYGGVGKALVECLVQYQVGHVVIGGRDTRKGEALRQALIRKYPAASLSVSHLDATDSGSLQSNFQGIDIAIVTATVPEYMELIAAAALEANADLIDILVRGDVVDKLAAFDESIRQNGRRFITQCGFHPGLIAPIMRLAKPHFDEYREARVALAMEAVFEKPESIQEIFHEIIHYHAMVLEDGLWRKARYSDALKVEFSCFGTKSCFPLEMREINGIEKELGLSNAGVYAAGFGSYVDNFIFPLAMVLGRLDPVLGEKVGSRLFFKRIKNKRYKKPQVEFILQASGRKDGKEKEVKLTLHSDDGYQLTAIAVVALLNQYFADRIPGPGLYIMGKVVAEKELFRDMEQMGVPLNVETL